MFLMIFFTCLGLLLWIGGDVAETILKNKYRKKEDEEDGRKSSK